MKTTNELIAEFYNNGGVKTIVAPRKKDPILIRRNKGSIALIGKKAHSLCISKCPKG